MKKLEYTEKRNTLVVAVETGISDLRDDLGAEIREVVDNASGTNFENSQRIQTLSDAADTLENISDVTIPEYVAEIEVSWQEGKKKSSKSPYPRWLRRDNAVAALQATVDALNTWVEDQGMEEEPKNESEGAMRLVKDMRKELEDKIGEVEGIIEELETIISDAEGIEFPGWGG